MEKEKMDRISEFTRLAKQRELTPQEQEERAALRQEYLAEWRRGAEETLSSTYIVDEHGNKRPLKKK